MLSVETSLGILLSAVVIVIFTFYSVGINNETRKPAVGFRLGSYKDGCVGVGPIDFLKHIPARMKQIVKVKFRVTAIVQILRSILIFCVVSEGKIIKFSNPCRTYNGHK